MRDPNGCECACTNMNSQSEGLHVGGGAAVGGEGRVLPVHERLPGRGQRRSHAIIGGQVLLRRPAGAHAAVHRGQVPLHAA